MKDTAFHLPCKNAAYNFSDEERGQQFTFNEKIKNQFQFFKALTNLSQIWRLINFQEYTENFQI
jgi:hypothetical protein